MTRKLAKAGGAYLAGMMAASFLTVILSLSLGAGASVGGFCLLAFFRPDRGSRKYSIGVCVLCFGLGVLCYSGYDLFAVRPLEKLDGREFSGGGVICAAEYYDNASLYTARFTFPSGIKGKAAFYLYNEERLVRGDSVTVSGILCVPDSSGFFDSKSRLSSRGVFLMLDEASLADYSIKNKNIFRAADNFRISSAAHFRSLLGGGSSGELLIGMLFGRSFCALDEKSTDMLSRAGISHIAAVSGLHMSIAAGIAAALAGALKFSKRAKFAAVTFSAAAFAVCADLTMSVVRSLIMILLVYSAGLVRRKNDPLTSLTAAFLIITAGCPYVIRNTSLMLSGAGVLGTAVAAPMVKKMCEDFVNAKTKRHTPYYAGGFVSAVISCVCAYCAVFPVSCLTFDEISVAAPLANILLSPFFTAAAAMAVTGAVLCGIPFLAFLGNAAVYSGSFFCALILKASEIIGSAKAAVIPTGLEIMPLFVIIILMAGAAGFTFSSRKSYGILIVSASVFICSAGLAVVRAAPEDATQIAVITEGKGCALVIYDNKSTHVADYSGNALCAAAVKSFIKRRGLISPSEIVVSSEKAAEIYGKKFYDTLIISPYNGEENENITSAEYIPGKQRIICGNAEITPMEKCALIDIDDISVAVVNGKDGFIQGDYDLIVINSAAKAEYKNNSYKTNYAVARRKFDGSLPVGRDAAFCECAYYKATENGLERKREISMLR